jgi:hypothetical protein
MKKIRNRILIIVSIILLFDTFIAFVSIAVSRKSLNYIPNLEFSISDYLQLLVAEVALFGPFLFEYWKSQKNYSKVNCLGVRFSGVEDFVENPKNIYLIGTVMNDSPVRLKNCNVTLKKITILEKGASIARVISIEKYLPWLSLADLSINLNPYETSSFIIGELVNRQVILDSDSFFDYEYFKLVYFSEKNVDRFIQEFKDSEAEFTINIHSENADIFKIVIAIDWPENTSSIKNMEMFIHKINPKVVEFEYIPIEK